MTDIYIAGIAMTVFGRHPERSLEDLAGEALRGALQDAGCAIRDPGIAYYSGITNGVLQGQTSIPGQVVLSKLGLEDIPIYNVENACASGSSAVNLAVLRMLNERGIDIPFPQRVYHMLPGAVPPTAPTTGQGA